MFCCLCSISATKHSSVMICWVLHLLTLSVRSDIIIQYVHYYLAVYDKWHLLNISLPLCQMVGFLLSCSVWCYSNASLKNLNIHIALVSTYVALSSVVNSNWCEVLYYFFNFLWCFCLYCNIHAWECFHFLCLHCVCECVCVYTLQTNEMNIYMYCSRL